MKKEYIVCSAIWLKSQGQSFSSTIGSVPNGVVFPGLKHKDCMSLISSMIPIEYFPAFEFIEGFLTSENKFVNRVATRFIAKRSVQITQEQYKEITELNSDLIFPIK